MKKSGKRFNHGSRQGKGKSRIARDMVPDQMPQVNDQLGTGITLRFCTTGIGGSTSASVSFQNLLDAWFIAGTATTAYQLFDFVRVRRVTVRATSGANSGGSTVTVGIEFPGLVAGGNGGGKQASNSQTGISKTAYVSLVPDRLSAAAFWQPSSADNAFVVRSTDENNSICLGTIIDVELSYKNSADVSPAALQSAIAAATPGNIYFGGLDGARLAATWARSVFVPRL